MKINKWVKWWLFVGLVMIFLQIVLGGITRLTGSGLSITKWDIVIGSIPPLNQGDWQAAFDLYKETPQFQKVNNLMDLGAFKQIYFWEYIHRLWARLMGFVFIIPVFIFLLKSWIPKPLKIRLSVVFLLALLVASFGWIMVASGLINRPLVNAYKLSFHLILALILYIYLLWTYLISVNNNKLYKYLAPYKKLFAFIFAFILLQMFFGGIMSGMKASLYYPSWPDMNGEYFPAVLFDSNYWNYENFVNYDSSRFMPALIQFLHRLFGYIIFLLSIVSLYKLWKSQSEITRLWTILFFLIILLQIILGVLTLIASRGTIPVLLGVLHQFNAILLLTLSVFMYYSSVNNTK